MYIKVDAQFPGGAVGDVTITESGDIHFTAPRNGSPRSLWYCFRIRAEYEKADAADSAGFIGQPLQLYQEELEVVLGINEARGYGYTCPVAKHGEDGTWERIDPGMIHYRVNEPREYRFTVFPRSETVYVAFCYPYIFSDFQRFTEGIPSSYRDFFRVDYTYNSSDGRPYPILLAAADRKLLSIQSSENRKTEYSASESPSRRKVVVITARHHAGEVPGSFVLEGILNEFFKGLDEGNPLYRTLLLAVIPFVDLDSVQVGRYGKDRPPVDFNRDWSSRPEHQEISHIQALEQQIASDHDIALYVDLHAPQPGGSTYIVPARTAVYHSPVYHSVWSFYSLFEQAAEALVTCRREDLDPHAINWSGAAYQHNATAWHAAAYDIPAFTLETSYHYDSIPRLLEPDDWRSFGERLLATAADHFFGPDDSINRSSEISRSPAVSVRGAANETIPDREMVWEHWDMVMLPERITFSPQGTTMSLAAESDGTAFLTYREHFSAGSRACIEITVRDLSAPLHLETVIYTYLEGCVLGGYDREWHMIPTREEMGGGHQVHRIVLLVGPSSPLAEELPRDAAGQGYDTFRVAVRISGMKGDIDLRITPCSNS